MGKLFINNDDIYCFGAGLPVLMPKDAHTPQPGEVVFNTMTYRSSETVQRTGYFQCSVTYIKVQIKFK